MINGNSYLWSWFNYNKYQFHIGDEVQLDQPCHFANQHWNGYDNSWQDSSSNKYFAEKSHLLISTLNRKLNTSGLSHEKIPLKMLKFGGLYKNENHIILLKQEVKILFQIKAFWRLMFK